MRKEDSAICWSLLAMVCIGAFFLNGQQFFLLAIAFMGIFVIRNNYLIAIPKVPGIKCYICAIFVSLVVGIFVNSIRNVARDLFYILPSLLWLFIGYNLTIKEGSIDTILKTMFLYAGIISLYCIFDIFIKMDFRFGTMRGVFGRKVYDVGMIFPVFLTEVLVLKKEIFGKKLDIFFLSIMFIQIIMSLGRTAILAMLIELAVILITMGYLYKGRSIINRLLGIVLLLGAMSVLLYKVIPQSIWTQFIDKVSSGFQEIELSNEIDSVPAAMHNWRAYEMQCSIAQWKNSNVLAQIFGQGLGTGVYIEFVPYSWSQMVVDQRIPILHNGFYTLLNKGGLIATFSLLWMFVGSFFMAYKKVKNAAYFSNYAVYLMGISISGIAITYVVRGPVVQGEFLPWAVLTGCLCSESIILKQRR